MGVEFDDVVDKTFFDTIKNLFLKHYPELVGVVAGVGTYKLMLEIGKLYGEANIFQDRTFLLGPPTSGYVFYKVADYYKRLHNYLKRYNLESIRLALEERLYTPSSRGLRRFLDATFENPRSVSLTASVLPAIGVYSLVNRLVHDVTYFNSIGEPLPQDFNTQYGVAFAVRAFGIPLTYSLANLSCKMLSAIFHSENTSLARKMLPVLFYGKLIRFKRFREKYKESLESIVQTEVYLPAFYDLANILIRYEEKVDQGFLIHLRGIRLLKERGKPSYPTLDLLLSRVQDARRLEILSDHEKELEKDPIIGNYFSVAVYHLNLNNPDGSVDVLNDFSKRYSAFVSHAGVLKVEILDEFDRKEEATQELKDLFSILRTEEYKKEVIGETTRDVYVFGPSEFIKGSLLFKESTSLDDLEFEANLVHSLEDLIADYEEYKLPLQVANIFDYEKNHEKRFVYTERFVPSQTLLEKFEQGDFFDLESVVNYLALIHSHSPLKSKSEKGRLRLALKMKSKLTDKDFGCPRSLARRFIHNYRPVFDSFKDAIYVFNKDAHPENWLIAEDGSIVAVDFQDKGIVPIQFDLVNLMEYGAFLSYEQKLKVLDDYVDSYNRHERARVIKNREKFRLTYFNAVIQRAISLGSAWSSPDRTTMWEKRPIVIENAINAIDIIKREHVDYYKRYKENYLNLREALIELKDLVSV